MAQAEVFTAIHPNIAKKGIWLANWKDLTFSTHAHHDAQKSFVFRRVQIWVDLGCLTMEEKVHLKLSIKLGCSPRYTQLVPKWHLAGQLARTIFFNTCDVQNSLVFAESEPSS